jgi:ParB family chromosome partitioning protein
VPALVRDTPDDALLRDALLENLHRVQLNALEEAAAYQQLLDDFGCTQEELATRLGKSRPAVTNALRLLRLPTSVQRRVAAGVLSAGHARALVALESPAQAEVLANRVVVEGMSVRALEEAIALGDTDDTTKRRKRRSPRPSPHAHVADELSDRLDTRVKVTGTAKRGKISIEFGSPDDLGRILDALKDPTTWA